jgi:2-polyprenyl-3-methyl-5-hydroxy-6-metoxy-1,4-benzoquinol methylase
MGKPNSPPPAGHYNANYGNFQTELYAQIRHEAFGEDIGQNSWLTSDEQDRVSEWLDLSPGKRLLDVACEAGGPALRIATTTGCSVVGIDVHEQAVTTASSLAAQRGLTERAEFRSIDATGPLPSADASFDAITCIDAINHFSDRPRVIAEWARLLKLGGRLLFTDPVTLTGPVTNAEFAVRSSAGFYLFVPHGYDESVIAECGCDPAGVFPRSN